MKINILIKSSLLLLTLVLLLGANAMGIELNQREKLESLIVEIAKTKFKVDPYLALAIAYVETGIDSTRVRYEPHWRYLLNPDKYAKSLGITKETEIVLQSMSYSALQIMGTNARILGFNESLILLSDPTLGIFYACKHLELLSKSFKKEKDVISAYNGGSQALLKNGTYKNSEYVTKVSERLKFLRMEKK